MAYRLPTEAEWEYAARGGAEALRKAKLKQKYDELVGAGRKLIEAEKWTEAEAKFQEALKCGHGETSAAEEGVKTARGGAELKRKRAAAKAAFERTLHEAQNAYDKAKSLGKESREAVRLCDQAMSAIVSLDDKHASLLPAADRVKIDQMETRIKALKKTLYSGPSEGQSWTIPELDMKLVWVAPGSFEMGTNDGESNEKPVHNVTISKGFWMGKYEVTNAEYKHFIKESEYDGFGDGSSNTYLLHFKHSVADKIPGLVSAKGVPTGKEYPICYVSWKNAVKFCEWLTRRERLAGRLPSGFIYRLPSEAEWEYAARGGRKSRGYTYSGSNDLDDVGWYSGGTFSGNSDAKLHPVGKLKANELGFHDMSGNVEEYCLDKCDKRKIGRTRTGACTDTYINNIVDPLCENGSFRVIRGGYYRNRDAYNCTVTRRSWAHPDFASYNGSEGFRVCLGQNL